jgi:hypothetical protein
VNTAIKHFLALAVLLSAGSLACAGEVSLVPQEQAIANYMISNPGQGRPSLTLNPIIEAVARARAKDMAVRNYFSHVNPDGVAANYLLRQAGYVLPAWWGTDPSANYVESIAAGYSDPGDTWNAWMNSPDHKAHLLAQNSFYASETCFGVGYYYDPNSTYKYYWVVITAPPPPPPALQVDTPTAFEKVTTDTIAVAGATSAASNAASVQFRVENAGGIGDYQAATGVTSWSGTASGLAPGSNVLRFQSLDGSGNVIAQETTTVTYVVPGTLTVGVSGSGSVTTALAGVTTQDVGMPITVSAKAAPGSIFAGWTGAVTSGSATVTFTMQDGLSLEANFIPNPFIAAGGAYYGILMNGDAQSGIARFAVSTTGRFTGRVILDGGSWAFTGQLDANGLATVTVPRHGASPLTISVQVSLTGAGSVTGTVSDGANSFAFSASQSTFNAKTNAAPQTGHYTFVMAPDPNVSGTAAPAGNGYAAIVVASNGAVTLAGRLADNTPYSATGYVANDGTLAFYAVPSGAAPGSSVEGLITFRASDVSDVDGFVTWTKGARATDAFYPAGFSVQLPSVGSRYIRPGAGLQPMDATAGGATADFGAGNLEQPLNVPVVVTQSGKAVMATPGLPDVTLTINPLSGTVSGGFLLPGGNLSRGVRGVVFQKQKSAYGYFRGVDQCGYFSLTQG